MTNLGIEDGDGDNNVMLLLTRVSVILTTVMLR